MSSPARTTRRTLVRTAAHSAWAVPVVSRATAAPAYAATSMPGDEFVGVDAEFYIHDWGDGTFGLVPRITMTNLGRVPVRVVDLSLRFPSDAFVGIRTDSDPPLPGEDHFSRIQTGGWTYAWQDSLGQPLLQLDLYYDLSSDLDHDPRPPLGPGESLTVGTFADPAHPVTLDWSRDPTASSVWLAVGYAAPYVWGWGYNVAVGYLLRVDPPGP